VYAIRLDHAAIPAQLPADIVGTVTTVVVLVVVWPAVVIVVVLFIVVRVGLAPVPEHAATALQSPVGLLAGASEAENFA